MRSLALAVVAISLGMAAVPARADDFYVVPSAEIAGKPGTVIRAETFKAPPGASAAYRILYRSRGLDGQPIPVSAVVVVPDSPAPPGGRPIVSWAHATSGIARNCARSMYSSLYTNMYGLQDMLAKGMVVVATDYPGLGVGGRHPYLIGKAQGHAVLDAARAARALPEVQAGKDFAVAGYSQGGHASLYAGILARSYAPELNLVGIAASAPPTDLGALIREAGDNPVGKVFATFALVSWSRLYTIPLHNVIEGRVSLVAENIASSCNMEFGQSFKLMFAEQAFEREGFLKADVTRMSPWKELLARNSPGPTPRGVPVFIAQGTEDDLVRPDVTQAYVNRLCGRGVRVEVVPIRGGHEETGPGAAKPMANWLAARFAGKSAPSDCGRGVSAGRRSERPEQKAQAGSVARTAVSGTRRFDLADAEAR